MCMPTCRSALRSAGAVGLAVLLLSAGATELFAQTPFVPYFGKNRVRYNNFDWHIYTTDHFEIYYYPELEKHLERVAGYAESAYQQVSADLKHDLAFKVPLVLYKTSSEFQQQNVLPEEMPERMLAFAEPMRDRMVLPIDEPPDQLYRIIAHELTHIFEFDIIPRSLVRRGLPLWVDEGLSNYEAGYWHPLDLMQVRDAAIADIIPKMSEFETPALSGRLPYSLGMACFEFIESKWGKEGLRQFLFALRKSVIGGGENAYEEAFRLKPEEFDEQFDKYLKDRFKAFRDKERPADYGRNLAPRPDKTKYPVTVSIEPSPSGDLIAAAAGNRKDQELDIILISSKDGQVIRNLTGGFNKDKGYEYIATPGGLRNNPESPNISPDGRYVAFSALREASSDIFTIDLETREIKNLTNDSFGDYGPTFAPDGKSIVYIARVSGNDKLFRLDLSSGQKTQITFGTHDDGGAKFIDGDTIVFPSTATDPAQPIDPEVARNGNPIVLRDQATPRVAFVSYYKGEYGVHTLSRPDPIHTVASADFGSPGPIIDFQSPLTHTFIPANTRKKGTFEKMFLEGRPPVNVGVTSGGDIFGGTAVSFTDVLGDKQFNLFAASVSQYRTLSGSYVNLSKRLQYALQGFSQTQFFYGYLPGLYYDPSYAFIDRDFAIATRTARGASAFAIYPLNRYSRVELSAGLYNFNEQYDDPTVEDLAKQYEEALYGTTVFRNGNIMPLGITFTNETTIFREFGPLAGRTMRLGYEVSPSFGGFLSRQTVDLDARHYMRIGTTGLFAVRARGFKSWGDFPDFMYFGGNSEMRGYQYLEFLGHNAGFVNAELRFPLIEAMATPVGILGGIRGVFFFDVGGAALKGQPFTFATSKDEIVDTIAGFQFDPVTGGFVPVPGEPKAISGFRLKDGRASYGVGLETFALGFPIHFDWSWRTLFNKDWENVLFAAQGGSSEFRKPRFSIGSA